MAALLTALVIAVAAAGWLMSLTPPPPRHLRTRPTPVRRQRICRPTNQTRPPRPPRLNPQHNQLRPVDLSSPEAAAVSWMAAWCPIDPHRNPEALAAGIRGGDDPEGWAQFTATPGQILADTAPGVTASCTTPTARIVSRPPGSDTTVVVLVSATRTITSPDNAGATEAFPDRAAAVRRPGRRRVVAGRRAGGGWLMVLRLAGRGLAARAVGIKAVVLLGGGGTGVLVAGIVLILVLAVGLGDGAQISTTAPGGGGCPVGAATCTGEAFDPGNIISDNEFYNTAAMTEAADPGLHRAAGRGLRRQQLPPLDPRGHGGSAGGCVLRGGDRRDRAGCGGGDRPGVRRVRGEPAGDAGDPAEGIPAAEPHRPHPRARMRRRGGGTARTPDRAAPRTATPPTPGW